MRKVILTVIKFRMSRITKIINNGVGTRNKIKSENEEDASFVMRSTHFSNTLIEALFDSAEKPPDPN